MNILTTARRVAFAFTTVFLLACPARADVPAVYQDSPGIAVKGYDVVAYFTERRAVKGSGAFVAKHDGATWRFVSPEHRDLFKAAPEKYAPQYGGYCAYAVSQGAVATTVPDAWSIVGGKLYLNYSLGVRKRWESDKERYIGAANKNWPGVLQ